MSADELADEMRRLSVLFYVKSTASVRTIFGRLRCWWRGYCQFTGDNDYCDSCGWSFLYRGTA